jgi:uncharacterized protein YggU (UPF0235/DUF167 family)
MGRPPIGERAMTEAERKRRLRALAKARLAEQPEPVSRDHAVLVKELVQAKARIAKLEQGGQANADEITALKKELAAAKEHITEMGLQYAAQRQAFRDEWKRRMATAKPRAEKPRIKALTTENQNLKAKLRHMEGHYNDRIVKAGDLPPSTKIAFDKVLQPDARRHMSRAELDAALDGICTLWNAWTDDKDRAHRKGRS